MKITISNRVFWAGVFLAGCALLGHGAGARKAAEDTVEARHFVLIDGAGKRRAVLQVATDGAATLEMVGPTGKTNVRLTTGTKDDPSLQWTESPGGVRLSAVTPEAPSAGSSDTAPSNPPAPSPDKPAPAPDPAGDGWRTVATFSGSGGGDIPRTRSFRVRRRWRIRYHLPAAESGGAVKLRASLYSVRDGRLVGSVLDVSQSGDGTSIASAPAGEYTLQITAGGAYEISVEEQR